MGKKVLTLQIDKQCFNQILDGDQTTERRYVYPRNAKKYVYFEADGKTYINQDDIPEGSKIVKVVPVEYDALYLINGRRKDAPRMLIEVQGAKWYILTDENGKDLTFTQNGMEYLVSQVWYYLGEVVFTENCGNEEIEFCGGKIIGELPS